MRRSTSGWEPFLITNVDPIAIDETGEYPHDVIEGLMAMGAFGMKIPTEYGGLGFTQREYERVMELVGSHDANITALFPLTSRSECHNP